MLQNEIAGMEDRQDPAKPATLISSLRCALAAQVGCEVHQTATKMWEVLSCTGFDHVDEAKTVMIVRGEVVEKGMRRIM